MQGISLPDWMQPWFEPFGDRGVRVMTALAQGRSVAQALNQAADDPSSAPVLFVPQSDLPAGQAYERHIFHTKQCPTRDNLHDLFNGLCWQRFALTKAQLNAMQATEIESAGIGQVRGPVRDALTLFDENAAFLIAPDAVWDALQARDWRRLFVDLRPLWREAQLVLFGHALLEKLVQPYKSITAHVYLARPPAGSIAALDTWIAASLKSGGRDALARKPFTPLPVLGVPGWCAESENFSFYDDSFVFRPSRQEQLQKTCASGPARVA